MPQGWSAASSRAAGSSWIRQSERTAAIRAARQTGTVEERATLLVARHVDDLSEEEAVDVVKFACEAVDALTVGYFPSADKVADYVKAHVPGTYGRRSRVLALAEELRSVSSVLEIMSKVVVASICEAAG